MNRNSLMNGYVTERIKKQVMEEYQKSDTELNSCFFEFSLPGATYRNALDAYRELCAEINGDYVEFISDAQTNGNNIVSGELVPYQKCAELFNNSLIPSGMTIADALTEIEKFCKIYRVIDLKVQDGDTVTGGEIVPFVW